MTPMTPMTPTDLFQRKQVRDSIIACTSCSLRSNCKSPVPFSGPTPAEIVVIGEAPGHVEDEENRPFVGPAGKLARGWLTDAGISPDLVAWINVVSCFPNRTPTSAEIAACRPNLDAQLSLIRPSFALVLGGIAVSAWWPGIRIGDVRGQWWKIGDAWAMATWHPAAALRNSRLITEAVKDIQRFRFCYKLQGRDPETPILTTPLNKRCIKCGEWADKWLDERGNETNGYGMPYCLKHYEVLCGLAGKGRIGVGNGIRKPTKARRKTVDVKTEGML